jgi:DNA repair protein RadD
MVNVNVLTTGFDDPEIDLIALLRPTKSPVIHIQTVGRGLRIASGKEHCLIMDFAGNTERLGPINDIQIYTKRKGQRQGEPITKTCPVCNTIHHPVVKICPFCGHKFQFKQLLTTSASSKDIVTDGKPKWYNIEDVLYSIHTKRNAPEMVKVTYQSGLRSFNEYVCIEHPGYAGYKAKHWASYRGVDKADTAFQLLSQSKNLRRPRRIQVSTKGKYPIIVDYDFSEEAAIRQI